MKHLLTGVAMAAALAIAAPAAWAQNAPMTPSAPPKAAAAAPKAPAAAKPASASTMARKPMRHHHRWHRASSGDQMTEQLNSQELQRIMGGAPAPAPAPAPMGPGGNNPTSGTAGPFAPAGSAPPPPAR